MPGTPRTARVTARRALTARVNELVLEVPGAPPFRWRAGQHLVIHTEGAATSHEGPLPYSIASAWDGREPPAFALAIGPGSGAELLADAGPGTPLLVDGPYGSFPLPDGPGALLVGAGTGCAPLRALVQEWAQAGAASHVVLLAGARHESELLWHVELGALAERFPLFRYEPVLSQPLAPWAGRTGYVQDHLLDLAQGLPDGFGARVCGQTSMVESCLGLLAEFGLPRARVLSEAY